MRLDNTIREKFDGKRWSLPAVVYARALELYPGLAFSPQMLEDELQLAGYHRADTDAGAGAYARRGETIDIVTRDFQYPSGLEKSDRISVRFTGERVAAIDPHRHRRAAGPGPDRSGPDRQFSSDRTRGQNAS